MPSGYDINLDDKYGQLAIIDIAEEAARHAPWFNQTLTSVNGTVYGWRDRGRGLELRAARAAAGIHGAEGGCGTRRAHQPAR
jgi:hypothetical protein